MANEYILFLYHMMWGLLVFSCVCFLISGIDDLFFDIYYWSSYLIRLIRLRKSKKLTYEKLSTLPEKKIAVMIPCWHEAGVIENMLKHNVLSIDYSHYDFFVGVYPNDPNTVQAVKDTAAELPHIQCVINRKPGPTNKADNLNAIYEYIMEYEKEHGEYDIFVMHDSEDVIHPLSFKFYNYLMPKISMVQLPIFPLEVGLNHMTHWTYAAEFSEIHTKDIVVRESIGGLVPSAGVGTAFSRATMQMLITVRGSLPFSTNTLTEDYSTALQVRLHGLKQIFASQYVYRTKWCHKWFFFGPIVAKRVKEFIAARSIFPMSYSKSVRQKTRWILGISFQEWINTGWRGNLTTLYTLLHDRKTIFTHLISGLFFILIPFWVIYAIAVENRPEYPTLQDLFKKNPWVWDIIIISSILMLNRILQRFIAVTRVYGFIPGLFSIILILYANIINLHALLRAYVQFIFIPHKKDGTSMPKWDKTDHEFPVKHLLVSSKLPLGNLLLEQKLISKDMLITAIDEQGRTGEQLGQTLVRLKYITKKEISEALAKQYQLPLVSHNELTILPRSALPKISRSHYKELIHAHHYPIKIDGNIVTVAIKDPSNEMKISKILKWLKPYTVTFALLD